VLGPTITQLKFRVIHEATTSLVLEHFQGMLIMSQLKELELSGFSDDDWRLEAALNVCARASLYLEKITLGTQTALIHAIFARLSHLSTLKQIAFRHEDLEVSASYPPELAPPPSSQPAGFAAFKSLDLVINGASQVLLLFQECHSPRWSRLDIEINMYNDPNNVECIRVLLATIAKAHPSLTELSTHLRGRTSATAPVTFAIFQPVINDLRLKVFSVLDDLILSFSPWDIVRMARSLGPTVETI
jgi:hypothetical protein